MIIEGKLIEQTQNLKEKTDVCIIGSGAAGAILAWELAEKGHKVVVLEKGSYFSKQTFTQREDEMIPRIYKNAGFQFTIPSGILVAQGSCVGGSTVVNDAVCFRAPDTVLDEWSDVFQIKDIDADSMKNYFGKVEKRISVSQIRPDEINKNNAVLKRGCELLNWKAGPNQRNCISCRQCGLCHLGCSYGTKQSMLETYISDCEINHQNDVKIIANCEAEILTTANGRITAVKAVIHGKNGPIPLTVRSKIFIVSSGTFASSELLLKSNLNQHGHVGKNIALHPSPALLGDFEEEINGSQGIPMGYHCDEFSVLKTGKRGYLIESVFLAPYQFLLTLPGYQYENKELMKRYSHYAMAGILLQDEPVGRVSLEGPFGSMIFYRLTSGDSKMMIEGMKNAARIFFATGATRVITSHRKKTVLYGEDDLTLIDERGVGNLDINLGSGHPQGGNRMGGNPRTSVVDSYGKFHGIENLFVCDASIFPSSLGVNPQLTVMSLAVRTAEHIANDSHKLLVMGSGN